MAMVFFMGCATPDRLPQRYVESQNQVIKLTDENRKLTKELIDTRQAVARQQEQIATLHKLGPARYEDLIHVGAIVLDRTTGGYDENRDGYEDGVNVYLKPYDTNGHVFETAGIARVRLFELSDQPRLIGECVWQPKEIVKTWVGRFWTNHYALRCPFTKPPRSRHITIHVEFTELLTGKPFVAEKLIEIKLPVATTTSAPAATTAPAD